MAVREDVRRKLIEVAKNKKTIAYGEVMKEFGIPSVAIGRIVGNISIDEHDNGRPMLSAIVIHKSGNSIGTGFFSLARDLGLLTNQNENDFWHQEQQKVWDCRY